jgi:hypothetical protein|tara:strand:- start:4077 stop:4283 length:207 start_codon:yes stop_codon:yes gene_type:complete|eukprot:29150-Pelagococcus_subviridis.AAC.1
MASANDSDGDDELVFQPAEGFVFDVSDDEDGPAQPAWDFSGGRRHRTSVRPSSLPSVRGRRGTRRAIR